MKVARKRPAVPCSARRTNGGVCKNYAMLGGTVCHAHGGMAPQTRRAAARRVEYAKVWELMERASARLQARRVAIEPWADDIYLARCVDAIYPPEQVKSLRRIARELTFVARVLRDEARMLEAEYSESSEDNR